MDPASACASGGMPRWVMVAGLQIRVAKPPREEARVISSRPFRNRRRAARHAEADHEAGAGLLAVGERLVGMGVEPG